MFVDETDSHVNEHIKVAYREKYHRYPKEYVNAYLITAARPATLKLLPC